MAEKHDIPEWYIPDDEQIIANDHEREEIEENGELDEPLCPHCGREYEYEEGGYYIHRMKPVDGEMPEWEPMTDEFGRVIGRKRGAKMTPATWCNPAGEWEHDDMKPWDFGDF